MAKPTTTGGSPKNAFTKTTRRRLPRKEKIASAAPNGKLTAAAIALAVRPMLIESPTMSKKSRKKRSPNS